MLTEGSPWFSCRPGSSRHLLETRRWAGGFFNSITSQSWYFGCVGFVLVFVYFCKCQVSHSGQDSLTSIPYENYLTRLQEGRLLDKTSFFHSLLYLSLVGCGRRAGFPTRVGLTVLSSSASLKCIFYQAPYYAFIFQEKHEMLYNNNNSHSLLLIV